MKGPDAHDLLLAAEWCEEYEGADGEDNSPFLRVAAWLRKEAERRAEESMIRRVMAKTGKSRAKVAPIVRAKLNER